MRVLLLGGTAEARALAAELDAAGVDVVSSLAGRVRRPRLPVGSLRVGGFGGVEGLVAYLAADRVDAVVDATHPFAATISGNAAEACTLAGVPLLRLARPGWSTLPGAQGWHWVDDHDAAAQTAAALGSRVLLTTGRQSLDRFTAPLAAHDVLVRVVDPLPDDLPPGWRVLLDRGPYTVPGERALMAAHGTDVLVTKDSGGDHTRAKLDAAWMLGVETVVVRRPPGRSDVESVSDVADAVRWTLGRRG
ncbi:MAG: cobalt-precorrin-6A reductase [Nocardioides sp.]